MKVFISCHECGIEMQKGGEARQTQYEVAVSNSSVYPLTCNYGHNTLVHLQNSKFEIIFQSGINALTEGYYREAVFNFSLALERFYEFSILFFLYEKFTAKFQKSWPWMDERGQNKYQSLWDSMSKQSERQVGAFYSLYFNEFEEVPPMFSASWTKNKPELHLKIEGKKVDPVYFRNIVIHQGHLPTKADAVRYGEAVQQYIYFFIKQYREKNAETIINIIDNDRVNDLKKITDEQEIDAKRFLQVVTGLASLIGVTQPNYISKKPSLFDLFPL